MSVSHLDSRYISLKSRPSFQVQKLEQEKLALTVEYQLAAQNLQDSQTATLEKESQCQGLRQQLNQLKDKISDQMEEVRYILAEFDPPVE